MRAVKLCAALIVLAGLGMVACKQTPQQETDSNQPQSAVAVKDNTQTLALESLGGSSTSPFDHSRAQHHQPLNADVNRTVVEAFQHKKSDVWVEGAGEVSKVLPDDNKGARHQKFLVRINAQQTLLFAHNIDLAPKIEALKVGDTIEFKGEYVFNPKGGVVHWTHRDPQGQQAGGWIQHNGHRYQ